MTSAIDDLPTDFLSCYDNTDSSSFNRLPKEIRLTIWEIVCSVPRLIKIRLHQSAFGFLSSPGAKSPPTVLRICREAREVGLRHYELAFGTRKEEKKEPFFTVVTTTPDTIWVNWNRDIILPLCWQSLCALTRKMDGRVVNCNLKRLAVETGMQWGIYSHRGKYDQALTEIIVCIQPTSKHRLHTEYDMKHLHTLRLTTLSQQIVDSVGLPTPFVGSEERVGSSKFSEDYPKLVEFLKQSGRPMPRISFALFEVDGEVNSCLEHYLPDTVRIQGW